MTMDKFEKTYLTLVDQLDFLKQYDFYLDHKDITKSNFFGDRLVVHYKSASIDREVRIYYSDRTPESFSIFIDTSKKDGFLLSEYLSKKGNENINKNFTNNDPSLDNDLFTRNFCLALKYMCENYIKDILIGKEWESEPFDWTPYK